LASRSPVTTELPPTTAATTGLMVAVKLGYGRNSVIPQAILLLAPVSCIVPSNLPRTDRVGCAPCRLAASGSRACSRKRPEGAFEALARMPPNPKFAGADQGHAGREPATLPISRSARTPSMPNPRSSARRT
jgi:hypothetical protein